MADEIRYPVGFDPDRASAERAADPLDDAITKAMLSAIKTFTAEFRKGISVIGKAFAEDAGVRRFQVNLQGITEELRDTAQASHRFSESFSADLRSLEARARATQAAIAKSGNQGGIGASIEVQLRKTLELQRDMERDSVALARNPALIRAYENRAEIIRSGLAQDVKFVNRILEQGTQREVAELNQRNAAAAAASRERVAIVNADRSRNVVAQQREGALELEESRRTSRLKLQDERASARQRLAIIQAVSQQIRALERGISATLRGVGSVLGGIASGVSSTTGRITSIFRRSDAQMNAGLQPALERRSSIFRRELRQTESIISSSVVRQSALFAKAEAQASRGLAGVASGRSQLGGLLGGGLAIGGGFALLTKLKEGFKESVNLNESLNKTRQIFGDATDEILNFADTSVDALFVTKSAALEAAANFGIFGKSAGLAGPELAGFSKTLTVLATDLASFNNTSISDATTAIAAALRGESEPIRKYGVLLNEAVLQNRALALGITDTIRKLTPQERVLAANAEILAQTTVQQGDAARTANDFANSSRRAAAASTEFFASIAKFVVPLATVITNSLFPAFQALTAFVNGEVGPAMLVLRDGLIGAGIALGGLLAAKVAGEALKFLAIGVQAVLTPMGLLIAGVALAGAAIKILADRSPELRRVFDDVRESVGDRLREGLDLARRAISFLADVIVDRVLPAAIDLAIVVRDRLVQAFQATVGFVRDKVIPAFERLGRFLRDVVRPAIDEIVEGWKERWIPVLERLRERLDPVIEDLKRLWGAIRDVIGAVVSGDFSNIVELLRPIVGFLQPVTDAFGSLGSAISDAFSGHLGEALDRLRDFSGQSIAIIAGTAAVIAATFINPFLGIGLAIAGVLGAGLGSKLIEAMRPELERASAFLRDLFSPKSLTDVGLGFLKVVRRIGEIIGGIVTDRRFVTALAAIAAAIAATAGAALLGFADGVRANIPELIDLLGDALRLAFKEAFKFALSNPAIIASVIAGASVLGAIRRAFATAGAAGATGFTSSFMSGTRAFFQRNAFAAGLFGGASGLQAAATTQARKEADALVKARAKAARDVNLLAQGGLTATNVLPQAQRLIGPEDPLKTLQAIETQAGKTAVAGALLRTNLTEAFRGLGVAAGGLGKIISRDVTGGLQQASSGVSIFAKNIGQTFTRLRSDLRAAGIGLGVALGGAIASGIGAVLSGQALGTSESGLGKGIGLAGILSSALFASAATGGNVGVGVAVAAVGLLTAAFASNDAAAKAAADRIRGYIEALRDVKTPAEAATFAVDAINAGLLDLGPGAKRVLLDAGISVEGLSARFAAGTLNVKDLQDQIFALDGATATGARGITFATGDAAEALTFLNGLIDELGVAAAGADLDKNLQVDPVAAQLRETAAAADLFAGGQHRGVAGAAAALRELRAEAEQTRLDTVRDAIGDVSAAVDTLNQRRTDRINEQIGNVTDQLEEAKDAAELAREQITNFFTGREGTGAQLLDQLLGGVSGVGSQVGEAINLGLDTALGGAALNNALDGFGSSVAQIIQQAVAENPDITAADLSGQLDSLRAGIQQGADLDPDDMFTQAAADTLIGNINAFLTDADFDAAVTFAQTLEADVAELGSRWDALNVALEADIKFSPIQVRQALADILNVSPAEAGRVLGIALETLPEQAETGALLGADGFISGWVSGLEGGLGQVEGAATGVAEAAIRGVVRPLKIESPSKVMEDLGREVSAGLAKGIAESTDVVADAATGLTTQLQSVFATDYEDSFLSGLDSLVARIGGVGDALGEALSAGGQIGASAMRAAFEGLDDQIRELLAAGAADGSIFDRASAEAAIAPLFAAIGEAAALDPDDLFTDAVGARLRQRILDTLGGVDAQGGLRSLLPDLEAGDPSVNDNSNASRIARQVQGILNAFFDAQQALLTGFNPPTALGQGTVPVSVDMREGAVGNQGVQGVRIDQVNITETTNARATARETIMGLKTAAFTAVPIATANKVPVDVSPR